MATGEFTGSTITARTTSGVSAYTLVKNTGEYQDLTVETCGSSEKSVGVATHDAAAGALVVVAIDGIGPIKCGAGMTQGAHVQANSSGLAIGAAAADWYDAILLEDVSNSGDIGQSHIGGGYNAA